MPNEDAIVLPGIDAPAAPAPEPAAPSVGGTGESAPSANAQPDANASPNEPSADDPPEPTPEERAKRREARAEDRRFKEARQREDAANRRADETTQLLRELVTGLVKPREAQARADTLTDPANDPRPSEGQFGSWQEFNAAFVDWKVRQGVRAELTKVMQQGEEGRRAATQREQAESHAVAKGQLDNYVSADMQKAAAEIPDYVEVMQDAGDAIHNVPLNVEAAMALSGEAGRIAYYFAKNPQVMQRLARLPDMALSMQISRIASFMRNGGANHSTAPAPGRASGGRGGGPSEYPKNATPEQHMAWVKRNANRSSA